MRLIYFSPVPWASFSQRPHWFVKWFNTKKRGDVLWIDPYPTRLPAVADLRRICSDPMVAIKAAENWDNPVWLSILTPRALPVEPLPGAGALNSLLWRGVLLAIDAFIAENECVLVFGKPSKLALQVLTRHPNICSIYDAMDEFPAFYRGISSAAMVRMERLIAAKVSKISVSSTGLAARFDTYQSKLILALNACSADDLPPVNATTKVPDGNILGYVGTIGHWFDWRLVYAIAESNPAMLIRLIGPLYVLPPKPVPTNIELLPACSHGDAIRAMQAFSVGLIPFKCNNLTSSVDPIKYYEYRALGLPTLSSCFGEMALRRREPGVFLAESNTDFGALVNAAVSYRYEAKETRIFRRENSWEARFNASNILP